MKQIGKAVPLPAGVAVHDAIERIWTRREGESVKKYRYFKQYLQMRLPRSMAKLGRQLRMHPQGLRNYSAEFKWLERAEAYDDYQTHIDFEDKRIRKENLDLEWLERREELRQEEWKIGRQLLAKVKQMLATPLFEETVTETFKGLDAHGRIILQQIRINKPLDWSPSDMAKFFEVASKMMRLATGMETDRKKINIDWGAVSDDELDQIIAGGK